MSRNQTIRLYREDETRWHCSIRGCVNNGTHECSYDRDEAGSAGQVITARLARCRQHAQRFQHRHDARRIVNKVAT